MKTQTVVLVLLNGHVMHAWDTWEKAVKYVEAVYSNYIRSSSETVLSDERWLNFWSTLEGDKYDTVTVHEVRVRKDTW